MVRDQIEKKWRSRGVSSANRITVAPRLKFGLQNQYSRNHWTPDGKVVPIDKSGADATACIVFQILALLSSGVPHEFANISPKAIVLGSRAELSVANEGQALQATGRSNFRLHRDLAEILS